MNEDEKIMEERKEKLKQFFDNPYKICLWAIIAIATIIRLYFFNLVKNQAHWWDTLAYADLANNIIYGLWNDNAFVAHEAIIRPPLLPWIWSILIRMGVSDIGSLVFLEILPSILSVWLIYLIGKEMYDEKIGLIAGFLGAVSWIFLFYSMRIMTDIPSLFFSLASIYFFIKSYEEIKTKEFALAIVFLALAVMTRYSYGIIAFVYILFLAIVNKHHFLKKKGFWIGGLIGAVPLILFFILNLTKYGSILPAGSVYGQSATEKASFAFYVFGFTPYILKGLFTLIFIAGLLIIMWEILISYDSIGKIKKVRSNLFNALMLFAVFVFFVFILRAAEDRYLMIIMPMMFILSGIALNSLYNFMSSYSKPLAVIVILAVLVFGAYSQIVFASQIIENKKESYKQMKDAFEWIGKNTEDNAVLAGTGIDPYAIYYSKRKVVLNYTVEDLPGYTMQADYMILHRFEYQTEELVNYVNENAGEDKAFLPLNAFFFDSAQTQPAVIIYRINKDKII